MRKLLFVLFAAFVSNACFSENANKANTNETSSKTTIENSAESLDSEMVYVYYFHGKQRCKTCMAVEQVTKETIDQLYGNNQKVRYQEVLFDEAENKALVEKYAVTWSTLLIVKGDDYTDITRQAFANARNNPETLKNLLKSEIEKRILD